jgi:ankyrin repeat protein
MHQAALAGHEDVVRLLIQQGARLDLKDMLFGGTPADWAEHAGKTRLGQYLRRQEKRQHPEKQQIRKEE